MTDYAISKKSKRSLWIPILVFITLAACASAGYSYWHSHQVAADDKAQQRVVPSPVFYALDTFTVNLGDADRVLYIGITLRLKDEATRSRLSEYLPEVRSRLLLLFSRQDAAVLATEEGNHTFHPACCRATETGCHRRAVYRFYSAITTWAIVFFLKLKLMRC